MVLNIINRFSILETEEYLFRMLNIENNKIQIHALEFKII